MRGMLGRLGVGGEGGCFWSKEKERGLMSWEISDQLSGIDEEKRGIHRVSRTIFDALYDRYFVMGFCPSAIIARTLYITYNFRVIPMYLYIYTDINLGNPPCPALLRRAGRRQAQAPKALVVAGQGMS